MEGRDDQDVPNEVVRRRESPKEVTRRFAEKSLPHHENEEDEDERRREDDHEEMEDLRTEDR